MESAALPPEVGSRKIQHRVPIATQAGDLADGAADRHNESKYPIAFTTP
ncbi:MAG: hypothetical protein ACO3NK_04470 [Prochlorotrichaceae cyanobacterium]|jgi:hypothetical protein